MIKNVIITGANGFVGSNTVKYFLSQGADVVAIDIVSDPENLQENSHLKYIQYRPGTDICSLMLFIPFKKYDALIHFGWEGSSGNKRADCNVQLKNVIETIKFLNLAHDLQCKRFVGAGSIMEYETETVVHGQGNKPGPGYIYGAGKLAAHCMAKSVAASLGIDFLWGMITNTYGPGENSPRFINQTLKKIRNKEPLEFTSATQNYDFVYIDDVSEAFYRIAENGIPYKEYIIGSGDPKPLRQFIYEMIGATDPDAEPNFGNVPYTGVNMPLSTFSIDDLMFDTGYIPEVDFKTGIKRTYIDLL